MVMSLYDWWRSLPADCTATRSSTTSMYKTGTRYSSTSLTGLRAALAIILGVSLLSLRVPGTSTNVWERRKNAGDPGLSSRALWAGGIGSGEGETRK